MVLQDYCWAFSRCSWDLAFWVWLLKATWLALLTLRAVECKEVGKHLWPCFWFCLHQTTINMVYLWMRLPQRGGWGQEKHQLVQDGSSCSISHGPSLHVSCIWTTMICLFVFLPCLSTSSQLYPSFSMNFNSAALPSPLCVCLEVGRQKFNPVLLTPWVACQGIQCQ